MRLVIFDGCRFGYQTDSREEPFDLWPTDWPSSGGDGSVRKVVWCEEINTTGDERRGKDERWDTFRVNMNGKEEKKMRSSRIWRRKKITLAVHELRVWRFGVDRGGDEKKKKKMEEEDDIYRKKRVDWMREEKGEIVKWRE
jgi:hypothetical protein